VTVPPPAAPDPAVDAAPRRRGVLVRGLVALTDRVPTGWLAGILTAVFLGVTAAFGGLAAVAAPPVPEIEVGDTHRSGQFALTVERAVLIDELSDAGVFTEDGERVLVVVLTVENVWDRAQPAGSFAGSTGVVGAVRIAQLGDAPADAVARLDDATVAPYLQPGVPAELVLTWAVEDDAFADGDLLQLELRDSSLYEGQLITYGQQWEDPVLAARLTVEVADVGAGADAEAGAG